MNPPPSVAVVNRLKQSKPKGVCKQKITELSLEQSLAMTTASHFKKFFMSSLSTPMLQTINLEQEMRQTKLVEYKEKVSVNIAREDFPDINAYFDVWFYPSAPQVAWAKLLVDINKILGVEFIDCVVDRKDGGYCNRTLSLRDGGNYFVRQREDSAVLEVLITGKTPIQASWNVTMGVNDAKSSLRLDEEDVPRIAHRVKEIISRPMTRDEEYEVTKAVLNAKTVSELLDHVKNMMTRIVEIDEFSGLEKKTYDKNIDVVTVHRIALEQISRLEIRGKSDAHIYYREFEFLYETCRRFPHEVDIIVIAFKLINDIAPHIGSKKMEAYFLLLDSLHTYSPVAPPHRPKRSLRYLENAHHIEMTKKDVTNIITIVSDNFILLTSLKKKVDEEAEEDDNAAGAGSVGRDLRFNADDSKNCKIKAEFAHLAQSELINRGRGVADYVYSREGGGIAGSNYSRKNNDQQEYGDDGKSSRREEHDATKVENQNDASSIGIINSSSTSILPSIDKCNSSNIKAVNIDVNGKKLWRGTKGAIGTLKPQDAYVPEVASSVIKKPARKMKMIEEEKESMFKKVDLHKLAEDVAAEMAAKLAAEEANAEAEANSEATVKVAKKLTARERNRIPLVPGTTFRGISGKMKSDMVLLQAMITFYNIVLIHIGNRIAAMKAGIPEELSEIILCCNQKPKLLEYFCWIIDVIYSDGFGMPSDYDEKDEVSIAPSMLLSIWSEWSGKPFRGNPDFKDIEAISVISQPSVDMDGDFREKPPDVNLGDPNINYEVIDPSSAKRKKKEKKKNSKNANGEEEPEEEEKFKHIDDPFSVNAAAEEAQKNEKKTTGGGEKKTAVGKQNVKAIKGAKMDPKGAAKLEQEEEEKNNYENWDYKYFSRPNDSVILAMAMVAEHSDLQVRERTIAARWVETWDDCSLDFRYLKIKARSLTDV